MSAWPNTVTVGSFVGDYDVSGDSRVTVNLTGWDDGPAIRSGITERAGQNGGWDAPGVYGVRVIGMDGLVDQPDEASAQAIADELSALSPRDLHLFTVTKASAGTRTAMVRVTQRAVLEWLTSECFTYSMQFTAADPLRYGLPWYSGDVSLASAVPGTGRVWPRVWPRDWGVAPGVIPGAVTVPNAGLATYWPTVRINGPVTNPVVGIAETGDVIAFNQTIPAGQWIDIDCGARHVTFGANADDVYYLTDVQGRWLGIPPGGASFTYGADSGTGTAQVTGYEGAWD